jgi:hypothetical protein
VTVQMGGHLMALQAVQVSSVHQPMRDPGNAWGIPLFVVGVALLAAGFAPLIRRFLRRARAATAPGRVVDHEPRLGRRRVTWLPLVEFEADGRTVLFRAEPPYDRRSWTIGQPVEVFYDPANPRRAGLIESRAAIPWTLVAGVAMTGVFILIVFI